MKYYELIRKIPQVYNNLMDDESKKIYEARLRYLFDRNILNFWNSIKINKRWTTYFHESEYIVFGAGIYGSYMQSIIEENGKHVKVFLDNKRWEKGSFEGVDVVKPEEVINYSADLKIVLSNRKFAYEMKSQLVSLGVHEDRLIYEPDVCVFSGTQYFDVFSAKPDEIFLDCGAYDGATVFDFIKWCNKEDVNYKSIYSFEPDSLNYEKCSKFIAKMNIENIKLVNKGTWNCEDTLYFNNWGSGGSSVSDDGTFKINVTSIDRILSGQPATFIKMDIEGSELKSLEGAKTTISTYKPRLAISIYHKPEDIIEIPLYILNLVPEYKFKLRHYASNMCETILYCYLDD